MSQNRSAIQPMLLLAGFVLLSILIHSAFLATRFDESPSLGNITQIAPPLQVVVVSSRGSKINEPQEDLPEITTSKAPAQNMSPPVLPAKPAMKPVVPVIPPKAPVTATKQPETSQEKTNDPPDNSAQTSTASSETRKPAPVNHLRAQLRNQLARHFIYPRLARRMGWEGQVGLELHIEEDGSLHKIRVVRSSGYKVLDDNARSTLSDIGRITVASSMVINPVDTEIEVLYRLTE